MNTAIGLPNAHSIQYYPFAQAKVSHLVGSAECQTHGNRRGRMGSVRCVGRPNFIGEGRAQNNNALKKNWYVVLSFPCDAVQPFMLSPLSSHSFF